VHTMACSFKIEGLRRQHISLWVLSSFVQCYFRVVFLIFFSTEMDFGLYMVDLPGGKILINALDLSYHITLRS